VLDGVINRWQRGLSGRQGVKALSTGRLEPEALFDMFLISAIFPLIIDNCVLLLSPFAFDMFMSFFCVVEFIGNGDIGHKLWVC